MTETPLSTATQTQLVTLVPDSVKETMQPLLQDPMNCADPCFFGIVPGITTIDEAKTFLSSLGLPHKNDKDFYSIAYEYGMGRNSYATFYMSDRLVDSIVIVPEITKQEEGGKRQWIAYSPETLIKKYNKPSRVYFYLSWPGGGGSEIVMNMYFDSVKLIVQYTGENMFPSGTHSPRLCPLSGSFDYVRLWIGANPPNPPQTLEVVSLEKATSLTIDQFSKLMLGDPQNGCFNVNGDGFQ